MFTVDVSTIASGAALRPELQAADVNLSSATQTAQAGKRFVQKPDAVIMNEVATAGAAPIIAQANARKIPISISNHQVTPDLMKQAILNAGPSNKQRGGVGAELLANAMHGRGSIVVLAGTVGCSVVDDRDGLREKLNEIAPDITVIASQPGDWGEVKSSPP